MNRLLLLASVLIHYVILSAMVMTLMLGWHVLPWYAWMTLVALIGRVVTSKEECPLTTIENIIRKKLGLTRSRGFIGDYILRPARTWKYILGITKEY